MMSDETASPMSEISEPQVVRRDFLYLAAGAIGGMGAAIFVWPLIDSMNPAADVKALSTVEVDISGVAVGQRITVKWRNNPVFVDHRTPKEIAEARAGDHADLRDPQPDSARVKKPAWLVVIGVCTHLGCVPLGQRSGSDRGAWGGWFCPCHGSAYDTSGRIRKGPAPKNLVVPPYVFLNDHMLRVG